MLIFRKTGGQDRGGQGSGQRGVRAIPIKGKAEQGVVGQGRAKRRQATWTRDDLPVALKQPTRRSKCLVSLTPANDVLCCFVKLGSCLQQYCLALLNAIEGNVVPRISFDQEAFCGSDCFPQRD